MLFARKKTLHAFKIIIFDMIFFSFSQKEEIAPRFFSSFFVLSNKQSFFYKRSDDKIPQHCLFFENLLN